MKHEQEDHIALAAGFWRPRSSKGSNPGATTTIVESTPSQQPSISESVQRKKPTVFRSGGLLLNSSPPYLVKQDSLDPSGYVVSKLEWLGGFKSWRKGCRVVITNESDPSSSEEEMRSGRLEMRNGKLETLLANIGVVPTGATSKVRVIEVRFQEYKGKSYIVYPSPTPKQPAR